MVKRSVKLISNCFFFYAIKHSFHHVYQNSAEIPSFFLYFIISILKHQKIPDNHMRLKKSVGSMLKSTSYFLRN